MHSAARKRNVFAGFVALVIAAYYCYFNTAFVANDYGSYRPVWPLLLDVLVFVPLVYYIIFHPAPKQLLTASAAIAAGGLLIGRLLSYGQDTGLAKYSLILIAAEVALELYLLALLVPRVRQMLRTSSNIDAVMESAVRSKIALFEVRIWYYALFMRDGSRLQFRGEQHFRYDTNNGNASNQFGMIMMMLFEMPLSHVLLYFTVEESWVAWTVTLLTLWGLLYFVAEYRATRWRPISLDGDALIVRSGVLAADRVVPYAMVALVDTCTDDVRRQPGILRFRQMGVLNVRVQLREGSALPNLWGRLTPVSAIYLSLDQPGQFIDALRTRTAAPR